MPRRDPSTKTAFHIIHVAKVQAAPDPEDVPVPAVPGGGAPAGPPDGGPALGGCPPPPPNLTLCGTGPLTKTQALVVGVQQTRPAAFYFRLKDGGDPWWGGEWTDQENRSFLARLGRFQDKPPVPFPWGMFAKTFKTRVGYQCRKQYWAMVQAGVTMPFVLPAPTKRPYKARKRKATALTAMQEEGNTAAAEEKEVDSDEEDKEEEGIVIEAQGVVVEAAEVAEDENGEPAEDEEGEAAADGEGDADAGAEGEATAGEEGDATEGEGEGDVDWAAVAVREAL